LYALVLLAFFGYECIASESFDSFPLMKFDKLGQTPTTRKNSFNLAAASYHSAYDESASRSRAILLPYQEFLRRTELFKNGTYPNLSSTIIGNYQSTIAGGSSALIIVLPDQLDQETIPQWREAEQYLLTNELLIPVYFIFENEELHEVLSTIETSSGYEAVSVPEKIFNTLLGDNYQLTVSTKEQSALKQVTGTNIQGWLGGNGDVSSPTIAIIASYDSLSASPDLAKSTTSSTSSAAILLELARVFSKLYSQPRTQSNYNLLFVLTTGGHFNFYGSKQWLSEADDRLVKSLEAVICLDSLGEVSDSLYLHTSRPAKDVIAQRLYENFQSAAQSMQLNVEVKQKKVNVSNTEEPWEHEHFSKRRILASTLSSHSEPSPNFARSHIFDKGDDSTAAIVQKHTKLIAETLARHIFGSTNGLVVFEQSLEIGGELQNNWLNTLSNTPRVFPYIEDSFVEALENIMREYSSDTIKQTFTMNKNSEYTFYSANVPTELTISVAKPFVFDVVLALLIAGYLTGLYFISKQFKIFQ